MKKVLIPGGKGVPAVAEETGVSVPTLYSWIRKLRGSTEMENGITGPNERSLSEKHELLMESASLGPEALGEWLRGRGVHEEHLKLWRTELREVLESGGASTRRELARSHRENKSLQKEVRRKDKALAELTAIVVLKKKLETLLGEGEEP